MKKYVLLVMVSFGFFCTSKAQNRLGDPEVAMDATQVIPDTSKIYTSVEVLPSFPDGNFNSYWQRVLSGPRKTAWMYKVRLL
jgi:hypothetical protein